MLGAERPALEGLRELDLALGAVRPARPARQGRRDPARVSVLCFRPARRLFEAATAAEIRARPSGLTVRAFAASDILARVSGGCFRPMVKPRSPRPSTCPD